MKADDVRRVVGLARETLLTAVELDWDRPDACDGAAGRRSST
jgi:hypothetical protein